MVPGGTSTQEITVSVMGGCGETEGVMDECGGSKDRFAVGGGRIHRGTLSSEGKRVLMQ